MTIRFATVTRAALAATALATGGTAFAGHIIVYGARTEAQAASAAHQGPNVAISNAHYVNGAQLVGNTFVAGSGTVAGGGSTAQTYAQTTQNGGTNGGQPLHNDAFSQASLTTGLLKATTSSTGPNNFGTPSGGALARLDDTIFFTNNSGSTQTISFTYRFDGHLYDPFSGNPGGNVSLGLSCGGNLGACDNGLGQSITFADPNGNPLSLYGGVRKPEDNWNYYFDTNSSCFGENIYCGQYSNSLWEYGLNAPNANGVVHGYITAYLNIPIGLTSLGVRGTLNLDCRGASSCDFGNTGKFGFGPLPTGLTFGSGSGVFLTANATQGGVPEPATWAMLILGFGLIGVATRQSPSRTLRIRYN